MHEGVNTDEVDAAWMRRAVSLAANARLHATPNPWVGAILVTVDGESYEGWTAQDGGPHAERRVLAKAGQAAEGATVYTTLEPCSHVGRSGACTTALIEAGVARVVIGVSDTDEGERGRGAQTLIDAGVKVSGVNASIETLVRNQLEPYLHHRSTGRPYVVLKMAATLDGKTAAPDSSSRWITGAEARQDVHRLRAESDAIIVGAGTVRVDDPSLTVRDFVPGPKTECDDINPRRIVLGPVPTDAQVAPAESWVGELGILLDKLGNEGVVQVLVEGGPHVAGDFHRTGLVDRYVIYIAPALLGGGDGLPVLDGPGVPTMADVWRGDLVSVRQFGNDVRIEVKKPTT